MQADVSKRLSERVGLLIDKLDIRASVIAHEGFALALTIIGPSMKCTDGVRPTCFALALIYLFLERVMLMKTHISQ